MFEPGNQLRLGTKSPKRVQEAINRAIIQDDSKRLRKAIETQLDLAANGDLQALTFIRDTIEGKPAQAVTVSGDDERPLVSVIKTLIVYPDNSNGINSLRTVEGIEMKENSLLESQEQAAPPTLPLSVILAEGGVASEGPIPPITFTDFGNQEK